MSNDNKTLEDLLNELYPDKKNLNEVVIQDVTVDLTKKRDIGSTRNMQFAEGNAQIRDFFKMVGEICLLAMEDLNVEFLPYEYAVINRKDADQRLGKNIITYRIVDRRHSKESGYKPKETSNMLDAETDRTITRYTERFDTVVQFCFMSMNYDIAYDMMDMFEEIMINYAGEIRKAGIVEYNFINQNGDLIDNAFREIMIVFTLNFNVKTEKNRVITRENVKRVHVQGKAVDKTKN